MFRWTYLISAFCLKNSGRCVCFPMYILPNGPGPCGTVERSKMWDTVTGECNQELRGQTVRIWSLVVLWTGELASGSMDSTIRIWDMNTGECKQILREHTGWVSSLALLRNGQLVSGSYI